MIGKVRSRDAGEVIDYIISYFEFNVRPARLQRLPLEGLIILSSPLHGSI